MRAKQEEGNKTLLKKVPVIVILYDKIQWWSNSEMLRDIIEIPLTCKSLRIRGTGVEEFSYRHTPQNSKESGRQTQT